MHGERAPSGAGVAGGASRLALGCHANRRQLRERRERYRKAQHLACELRDRVRSVAASLRDMGVAEGDRVVAIARNGNEAIVAALATAAVGATFSSGSSSRSSGASDRWR